MSSLMLGVLDGMMQQPTLMTDLAQLPIDYCFILLWPSSLLLWHFAILTWMKGTSFFVAKMNRKSAVNVGKVPEIRVEILLLQWHMFQWPKFWALCKVRKTMGTRLSRYPTYCTCIMAPSLSWWSSLAEVLLLFGFCRCNMIKRDITAVRCVKPGQVITTRLGGATFWGSISQNHPGLSFVWVNNSTRWGPQDS